MKSFKEYLKEKEELDESSLSRIYQHAKDHDTGTISAFRGDNTKKENLTKSSKLEALLMHRGFSVTKVKGTYIENLGTKESKRVKETAFIVVDYVDKGTLKEDLIAIGTEFDQDAITYSKASGEYYLINTTKRKIKPFNGVIGAKIKLGKPMFGKDGNIHSKVNGRPFIFESVENGEFDNLLSRNISSIMCNRVFVRDEYPQFYRK